VAKIKYDVSNVEGGGDFPQPKPGLYTAKIDEVEAGESKAGNKQLRVIIKITKKGEFKGANLFHYVPLDPESPGYFRMKEFTKALGLKEKGTLDTDKMVGKEVLVRVKPDSYEGEYRARVGAVLAPKKDADDDADDDLDDDDTATDDDDDDDDDDTDDSADDGDDDDDDDSSDDGDDDDGDDYEEWSVDELKEELKGRGLRVAGKRAVLIGRLRKDDEDDDDPFS
jgi:hypothetical protein